MTRKEAETINNMLPFGIAAYIIGNIILVISLQLLYNMKEIQAISIFGIFIYLISSYFPYMHYKAYKRLKEKKS